MAGHSDFRIENQDGIVTHTPLLMLFDDAKTTGNNFYIVLSAIAKSRSKNPFSIYQLYYKQLDDLRIDRK
jgi:hypothetical protein